MTIQLDYFYRTDEKPDIGKFRFFRVPKLLFAIECYLSVSFEARMFFACLLDSVSLSMLNGLVDKDGRVFIFCTLETAMKLTGYGHNKVQRMFHELESVGLIERKAQGLGRPVRIYVKDFKAAAGTAAQDAQEMEQMVMDAYTDCMDGDLLSLMETGREPQETVERAVEDSLKDAAPMSERTETAPRADAASERTDAQSRTPASPASTQPRPEMPRPSARAAASAESLSALVEKFCPAFASALVSAVKCAFAGCGNVENFSTNVENSRPAPVRNGAGQPPVRPKGEAGQPETGGQDCRKRATNYTDNSKDTFSTDTYPINPGVSGKEKAAKKQEDMRITREVIEENIDYEGLIQSRPTRAEEIEGYVDLMVQACCSDKPTIRINCEDYPQAVVRSRFEKLTFRHIDYVLDCMEKTETKIRNIRAYTLSALFNSYATLESYYGAWVNYDRAERWKSMENDEDGDEDESRSYERGRSRSYAYA